MGKQGLMRMEPYNLRFTQQRISSTFRDGKSLQTLACQIAACIIHVDEVEVIKVVNHAGLHFSLDNRRLAVFRLLEMTGHIRHSRTLQQSMAPKHVIHEYS